MAIKNDSNFKNSLESGVNWDELWCREALSYPNVPRDVLRCLLEFTTKFLVQTVIMYSVDEEKQRNRLDASDYVRLALSSSINPRIPQRSNQTQAPKSRKSQVKQ